MYKITMTMVKSGKQEIVYCNDFDSDNVKLVLYQDAGSLMYLLHSVESIFFKEIEGDE